MYTDGLTLVHLCWVTSREGSRWRVSHRWHLFRRPSWRWLRRKHLPNTLRRSQATRYPSAVSWLATSTWDHSYSLFTVVESHWFCLARLVQTYGKLIARHCRNSLPIFLSVLNGGKYPCSILQITLHRVVLVFTARICWIFLIISVPFGCKNGIITYFIHVLGFEK